MNTINESQKSFATINIFSHHGSPGSPSDFDFFQESLKKNFQSGIKIKIKGENRFSNKNYFLKKKTKAVRLKKIESYQIGYSFGCTMALMSALENSDKTLGIILVSPYLFTEKISSFTKKILNTPLISPLILNTFGKKALTEMFIKSSAPLKIPENYKSNINKLASHHILRESSLEKDIAQSEILKILKKLEEKNIPILVLSGNQDQTVDKDKQIEPLKKFSNITVTQLHDAPHALLWTHNDVIAQEVTNFIMLTHGEYPKPTPYGYFPGENSLNNIFSHLENHNQKFPDKTILSWTEKDEVQNFVNELNNKTSTVPLISLNKITVNELYNLVNTTAQGFINQGIKKGDRALIFLPMSLPLYASILALQKIGAIAVFLDSWAKKEELKLSAQNIKPKMIISIEKAYHYLQGVREISKIPIKVVFGPHKIEDLISLEILMKSKGRGLTCPVNGEHTALITFQRDNFENLKGTERSHRFLSAKHYALLRHLPFSNRDLDLAFCPLLSLNNIIAGVETVIPSTDSTRPSEYDGALLFYQLMQNKITCATLSISLFSALSKFAHQNGFILDRLRRVAIYGLPVSRDDIKKMKKIAPYAEIVTVYGSSDVLPISHIEANKMQLSTIEDLPEDLVEEGVNVGHIDLALEYKFIKINKGALFVTNDDDWKKLEVDELEVGELILSGEHVSGGYYNNEQAFFNSKIKDHNGIIWHRTNDLGKLDYKNNLWLLGRIDNVICRKNKLFFQPRAEVVLKKLPFVNNGAFLGIPDKKLGEKAIVVITLSHPEEIGDPNKTESYKKSITKIFKKNKIAVDQIFILNEIPKVSKQNEEIEYNKLREIILESLNE